jgi:hypothetical protein
MKALNFALAVGWGATILFHDAIWKPQINISPTPVIFTPPTIAAPPGAASRSREADICDIEVPILLAGTHLREVARAGFLVQAMNCDIGKRVSDAESAIRVLKQLVEGPWPHPDPWGDD